MALGSAGGVGGSSSSSSSNLSALAPPFTVGRLNPKPNSNPLLKFTGAPITWQYPSHPSDNRSDVFPNLDLGVVDGSTRTTSMPLSNDYCYSGSESVNPAHSHWSGLNPGVKSPTNAYYVAEKSVNNPSSCHWSGVPAGVKSPTSALYVAEESVNPSSSQWSGLNPSIKSPTNAFYVAEESVNPSTSHWSGVSAGVKSPTNALYVAEESVNPSSSQWSGLNPSIKSPTNAFYVAEESVNPSTSQWPGLNPGVKSPTNAFYVAEESVNPSTSQWPGVNPGVKSPTNSYYVAEEAAKPSITHWCAFTPITKSSTSAFYVPEGKSYTPAYASPVMSKDTPLVSLNESVCGPLSASGVGNVSSQFDYTESLSGLEYVPQWGGVWNGLAETKRGKQVESGGRFSPEKVNGGTPLVYKNFMNQGPAVESSNVSRGEAGNSYGRSMDGIQRETHTGPFSAKITDDKSLFAQNLGFLRESSGTQFHGSSSPFLESPQSDPFKESSKNIFNCQKKYGPDSFKQDSAPLVKPSRAVVIRAPAKGASSPARNSATQKTVGTGNTILEGSFHTSKPDAGKELSTKRKFGDSIDTTVKGRNASQVAGTNVLSGLSLSLDHVQAFEYPENPSDSLDNHNPAEDSPCWKGAPVSQYSPLDVVPHQLLKKLEDCFNLDALGSEIAPRINEYTRAASENGTSDLNSPAKEHTSPDGGINFSEAVAYHVAENVLGSPSAQENLVDHHQSTGPVTPIVKMDVRTLINAIHNLSGLLYFNCSNDSSALKEQDHEVLKHAISNLDACLSKKIVSSNPAPEPIYPRQDISNQIDEFDQEVAKFGDQSQQRYQGTGNSYGQFDHQNMPSEKMNYSEPGKKAQYFLFSGDNERISGDDDMVQAIQKVLDENFNFEEDLHPQSILFKNLWLEAEAKLCSISTRARFERMKIQMKEYKSNISEIAANVGKVSGTNSSSETSTPASPAEDGSTPEGTSVNPTFSTTGHAHDVEVLARYYMPRCRDEKSNPEEQQQPNMIDNRKSEGLFNGDVEASVLARLNMLKRRDETANLEEQQQPDTIDTRNAEGQFGVFKGGVDPKEAINNHSSFSNSHADDVEGSVLARFNMLKHRDEKSNLKEEQQSYMVDTRKFEGEFGSSIGGFDPEGTIGDHSSFSTKRNDDDVNASVLERLNILKLRDDKNTEDPDTVHTRKAESQLGSSLMGVSGYESMKEFCLSMVNDPVIQPDRNGRFGNQASTSGSGWYDNSSSDWEHVLKDEFLWQ